MKLTASAPEKCLVSYTYNTDHTLNTKTDAKSQVFTYAYDSYGVQQVQVKTPGGFIYPGNQMRALQRGFNDALDHVEAVTNCAQFFESGFDSVQDAINAAVDLLTNTTYRLVVLPQGPGAGAQTVGPTDVQINTEGAFFTATPNADGSVIVGLPNTAGVITPVTFATKSLFEGFIILHEFGHQTKVYGDDVDSATNGTNSKAVLDNCFLKDAQGVYH